MGLNKDGKPRKRKTCSRCHQPGHWSKTCTNQVAAGNPPVTWGARVASALKGDSWSQSSQSSGESPSAPSSSVKTASQPGRVPPPIDLSAALGNLGAPKPSSQTPPQTSQGAPQPSQASPPPPQPQIPPQPSQGASQAQQDKTKQAVEAGEMIAGYWLAALSLANAYVEKHDGLVMGKEILRLNYAAAKHLATKWAMTSDINDDDLAAYMVSGTGAVMGGQAGWFFYRENFAKKKDVKKDANEQRAVDPNTGKPTPGAPVPGPVTNGAAKQPTGPARPALPGGDLSQYG